MSKRGKSRGKGKGKLDDDKDSLAFKVLNSDHTKALLEFEEVDAVQSKLQEILQVSDVDTDLSQGALLDYYVSGVWWAKEQSFNIEQISAFYTVLHQMLENIKEKQLPLTECLKEFKKLFAGIGLENPEVNGGLTCFDTTQAKQIMLYFDTSLFQHYKMYEFMFGQSQAEEIIGTDLVVDLPPPSHIPFPPPLEEAVTEEIHKEFIATPPPTPTPQEEPLLEGDGEISRTESELAAEAEHVADVLSQLTTQEVKTVLNQTFEEMLGGFKEEIQEKLRQRENDYIQKINKIHVVSSARSNRT